MHLAGVGGTDEPPALVDNVETLSDVPLILHHGVDWFRELGTDTSPGTVVCTISGAARRHGVGEIPLGTTLREAIDAIGWGPRAGASIGLVVGGTTNALIPSDLLDTPLTYEAMAAGGHRARIRRLHRVRRQHRSGRRRPGHLPLPRGGVLRTVRAVQA